ncbi:MAG TPA: hypothetical protein VK324_15570 [Tepidisphaeraceae bacterium]|nr:hypothetical protein [Tepidisphaeraceae bacterium]
MAKAKKPNPVPLKPETKRRDPDAPLFSDRTRRLLIHGLAVVCVATGGAVGAHLLRRHVETKLAYPSTPPKVVLKDRPAWMSDVLVDSITKSIGPVGMHSALDKQLLVDTAEQLRRNPWVKQVNEVRRAYGNAPGDTLVVDCDWRAPIALVKAGTSFWLVDGDGVKLPERFEPQQVPKVVMTPNKRPLIRIVEGVHVPPPGDGEAWVGADLAAGLEMIKLLFNQPYADDVVKVNVANYAGRVDPKEAQVVLVTKYDTEVRWGRPVTASDFFIEVPTSRKLEYLKGVYAEFGRLDARQRWIDIRFDKITYPSPTPETPTATAKGKAATGTSRTQTADTSR